MVSGVMFEKFWLSRIRLDFGSIFSSGFGSTLDASWAPLGTSGVPLGAILGSSWTAWGRLGDILGGVGALLGGLGGLLGRLGAILGPSCGLVRGSWAAGAFLEPSWDHLGRS